MAHLALNRLKIIILILGLTGHICCAEQVSTVTCSSTGTECSAIPFSICATNKCKCKDGYKEGPNGGSTCVKVLGTQCTGSDPCPGATSSVCTGSKCTCSTGYGERDNACKNCYRNVHQSLTVFETSSTVTCLR
ncbi:uncharacterized protein LOC132742057 [Ruditapes philippinarum]|uniref:uncharacterized protein LOC132742057 n=1 Tax=Ruditapes philippinarum TaxID=129788 RepID=UPI00295B632F|nr:uncharacterized protein LOC132742057 [Ruditapes philippinarum]